MGQINKIPLGYLNMLGAKTGGKNPFNATEVVAPTVDMVPFYHAPAMRSVQANYVPTAVGQQQSVIVPSDEVWFVYQIFNWKLTAAQSDRVRFQNAIVLPNSPTTGQTVHLSPEVFYGGASITAIGDGITFPVPIPLTQGVEITQIIRQHTGNATCFLQVMAAVFKG